MAQEIKIFGVTTDKATISSMLGTDNFGFFQKTDMGEYYGPRLSDGSIDTTKLVRVITQEQAKELNDAAMKRMSQIVDNSANAFSVPKINFDHTTSPAAKLDQKKELDKMKATAQAVREFIASTPKPDMTHFRENTSPEKLMNQKALDELKDTAQAVRESIASTPKPNMDQLRENTSPEKLMNQKALDELKDTVQHVKGVISTRPHLNYSYSG